MIYDIVYDKGTRLRVRAGKYAFTKEETYGLSETLLEYEFIDEVHISHRNGSILIFYNDLSKKSEILGILDKISQEDLYEKMISNIREVKARGAKVLLVAREGAKDAAAEAEKVIYLPRCDKFFSSIPLATVLQMLAYYVAKERNCDIDKPRNLAKSVTVE